MEVSFEDFISTYPDEVVENAYLVREMILGTIYHIDEEIDVTGRIIGYTLGHGYKNTLCTIIPSQKSLKLGFLNGSQLIDPECILEGSGKVHRYAEIKDFYAQRSYLKYLLGEAFKLWMQRS